MKEFRHVEVRAAETEKGGMILRGKPIIYDAKTVINDINGSYNEIIKRGALQGVDLKDTHLFYNHDLNKVPLARAPKTMQLTETADGLEIEAQLPDTPEARSVYTAVERGDLSGMSFAFSLDKSGSSYDAKSNTRSINKFNKILECSIVPFPAYQGTSVEARNQIDAAVAAENAKQAAIKKAKHTLNKIQFRGL